MESRARTATAVAGCLTMVLISSCAKSPMILRVSGTIMYDKPRIEDVSNVLADNRYEGGGAVLKVTMIGDPGLAATFDVYPDVADAQPMAETADGTYVGEFTFPEDAGGGPFTLVVRLRHDAAGETVWRDPNLILIPLLEPEP